MSKFGLSRKGLQYLMATFVAIVGFAAGVVWAGEPIYADGGAKFWGEITPDGQPHVCWRAFPANAIGDFWGRKWLHPLKDCDVVVTGDVSCTPLKGDGSFNLYWMGDTADPKTRRGIMVITNPRNGDKLSDKLGANICRMDDQAGHGSKLLVTANPATDQRCVK